jgi:hypothetical protein
MKKPGFFRISSPFILILLVLFPLSAQDDRQSQMKWGFQTAYYFPHQEGLNSRSGFDALTYEISPLPGTFVPLFGDRGRELGTGWGAVELQAWLDNTWTTPLLRGDGALTQDNNLQINTKWSLSPVTTNLDLSFSLTPIAFLVFKQGNMVGTGWNLGAPNGLGLNKDGTGNPETSAFPGVVYRGWFAGTFQFDLAAVLPGPDEWMHVVLQAEAKLQYQIFTAAGDNDPWQFQSDEGENFNGWQFHSSTVLGYMIPDLPVNFAGFMVETERRLGYASTLSTMGDGGWGSDFTKVRLGPLLNWQINENNGLTVLFQCHNGIQYEESSVYYNYFLNRRSTGDSYWYFDRVALSYTMKL